MKLLLSRHTFTNNSTIGTIAIVEEGGHLNNLCKVIEDRDILGPVGLDSSSAVSAIMAKKVHGKTAIPRGHYEIVVTFSNRFQRDLPLLVGVPGFEGIRIHPGNSAADTEGCLLPGMSASVDYVSQSRLAFDVVFNTIKMAAKKKEQVWITIQ